jgi:heme-degrading monooxygenase HmoA
MIVVLFRSRLTSAAGDDYQAMNDRMEERVRRMPGFVAVKSFQAEDGEQAPLTNAGHRSWISGRE